MFYSAVVRLPSSYNIVIFLVVHFAILLIVPVLIVRFICHRQRSQTHPSKEGKHPIELKYKCKRTTTHQRKALVPPPRPSAQEGKAVAFYIVKNNSKRTTHHPDYALLRRGPPPYSAELNRDVRLRYSLSINKKAITEVIAFCSALNVALLI